MHHLGIGATHNGKRVLAIADDTTITVIHLNTSELGYRPISVSRIRFCGRRFGDLRDFVMPYGAWLLRVLDAEVVAVYVAVG